MATQYTSPYNLPYPQAGDPVKEGQAAMELLAKRVNQVLTDGSFPSSTPDLAAITARMDALENRRVMLGRTTSQTLTTNAKTAISWETEKTLVSAFRNGSFPTRIYAPVSGQYSVTTTILLSAVSGGLRSVTLRLNGTESTQMEMANNIVPSATINNAVSAATYVGLNAGEYLEIYVEVLSPSAQVYALGGASNPELTSASRLTVQWTGPRVP